MNINQLKYVIKLADTKNFTKAAEELYISQPTLSQQVKLLEKEFGVMLFIRNRKKEVTLTEAGNDFVYYAERILSDIDKLQVALGNYCSPNSGKIRVGLLWTFGYANIDKCMNEFNKRYPLVKIKVYINGSSVLLDELQDNELDCAFVTGNYTKGDHDLINFDLVSQSDILAIMSKKHHLSERTYITAQDLDREMIMMVSKKSNIYPVLKKSLSVPDTNPIIIGESSQADVCLQIAESGLAIAFTSAQVMEYANGRDIKGVPFKPTIKRNIYLATMADSYKNNIISMFREFVINYSHNLKK
ncbi:MAG: LysR family transcriptional regulator [Clostridiales bacterium]|nr:LysR family transcriptional regulator [Clostridiales bacterium]